MGLIQSATASSHAEATTEGVSNESRSETSQKKDRFPELWAAGKIYLSKMHNFLHFTQIQSLLLQDAKSQMGNTGLYGK